jgi:hypothetical protein
MYQHDFNGMWMREDYYAMDEYRDIHSCVPEVT